MGYDREHTKPSLSASRNFLH